MFPETEMIPPEPEMKLQIPEITVKWEKKLSLTRPMIYLPLNPMKVPIQLMSPMMTLTVPTNPTTWNCQFVLNKGLQQ